MAKIFLGTTIICGVGWAFTWFLCLVITRYVARTGDCNPSKEELRDCAEIVI